MANTKKVVTKKRKYVRRDKTALAATNTADRVLVVMGSSTAVTSTLKSLNVAI